jgi:hypothetical protein
MFDWLFEAHRHPAVYICLAAAAVLFLVVWFRTRKRRWLIAAVVPVALAGLYWLLDVAVETDSEQIERKVYAMADGFKAPAHLDAVFDNVSDKFHTSYAQTKADLRDLAQQHIRDSGITEVRILEFHCPEASRANGAARADFRAKVVGNFGGGPDAVTVHCEAAFDYDAAHGWRMSALTVHGEGPIQIYQLGP